MSCSGGRRRNGELQHHAARHIIGVRREPLHLLRGHTPRGRRQADRVPKTRTTLSRGTERPTVPLPRMSLSGGGTVSHEEAVTWLLTFGAVMFLLFLVVVNHGKR